VVLFRDYLQAHGLWDGERDQALRQALFEEVTQAQKAAEAAPDPLPEQALQHVWYEG
jgi:TPP-dependent pyruvate/acetoin dehydrogenase alpha subunit